MAPGGEKAVLGRGSSSGTACVSKKKKIDENTFKPNHDNEFDNLKPVIRISIGEDRFFCGFIMEY